MAVYFSIQDTQSVAIQGRYEVGFYDAITTKHVKDWTHWNLSGDGIVNHCSVYGVAIHADLIKVDGLALGVLDRLARKPSSQHF